MKAAAKHVVTSNLGARSLGSWLLAPGHVTTTTLGGLALVGLFVVYLPLSSDVARLEMRLAEETERLSLARAIEDARGHRGSYLKLLPQSRDENWWARYFIEGTQAHAVQLDSLSPLEMKGLDTGPLKGLALKVSISGEYVNLIRLLAAMESGDPFVRIYQASLQKRGDTIRGQFELAILTHEVPDRAD